MSSSVHANNRVKNMIVFVKNFIQGLDNTFMQKYFIQSILLKIVKNYA